MRLAATASAALLASASAVDAGLSSDPHVGLVSRLHQNALHHSASLAKDIRIAFRGLLSDPPAQKNKRTKLEKRSAQKPFCVSRTGNGTASSDSGPKPSTSGVRPPAASSTSGASSSSTSASASSSASASGTKTSSSSTASATPSSDYNLEQSYTGSDFWTKWNFFTAADPTGGTVTYVDSGTAQSSGLAYVTSNGSAVMAVDTTAVVTGGRKSVRIQSQYVFNGGLVILDASHMPTGCGTWPAFWTNGPTWPYTGEIDILEGVNDYTENQATIHTTTGCTISSDTSGSTGTLVSVTNCDATATDNQGCGLRDSRTNSYGAGFNSVGGGVYAMLWSDDGVSIWYFQRSKIPSDISSSAPDPTGWGTPMANYPADSCNPSTFFKDHSAIFDTTLCGQWASGVWGVAGTAGQGDSCATSTGVATCEDYVLNHGAAFGEAFWEVNYVKIFQHK